jgi:hypothetical protein
MCDEQKTSPVAVLNKLPVQTKEYSWRYLKFTVLCQKGGQRNKMKRNKISQNFRKISDFVFREIWLKFQKIKIHKKRQI